MTLLHFLAETRAIYCFRFKNFLPDLEILKPPEEPVLAVGLFFFRRRHRYTAAGFTPARKTKMAETRDPTPRKPTALGAAVLWIWRFANTALLAAAVWILWQYLGELVATKQALLALVDYVSVIAERIH